MPPISNRGAETASGAAGADADNQSTHDSSGQDSSKSPGTVWWRIDLSWRFDWVFVVDVAFVDRRIDYPQCMRWCQSLHLCHHLDHKVSHSLSVPTFGANESKSEINVFTSFRSWGSNHTVPSPCVPSWYIEKNGEKKSCLRMNDVIYWFGLWFLHFMKLQLPLLLVLLPIQEVKAR